MEELTAANDKLERSKKKIAAELEDANIDLETQRQKVTELEKKQKNFDKVLAEEKAVSEQLAQEKDAVEKEARDKETLVLSLKRELDDSNVKIDELERVRRQLQGELDELVNNQGTADKNVHELEKVSNNLFFINTQIHRCKKNRVIKELWYCSIFELFQISRSNMFLRLEISIASRRE